MCKLTTSWLLLTKLQSVKRAPARVRYERKID